jgi:MoaA/NifB/PqqE/SkfB family radical SAM enzyme
MLKNTNDLIRNGNRCAIPWLHAQLHLQNNTVVPCCKYTNLSQPVESFIKIWTGDDFNNLRKDITENKKHSNCSACNVSDDVFSYRAMKNSTFIKDNISVDLYSNSLPKVFNISLKNVCNLSCRMCSPQSSSRLHEISKKSKYLTEFYSYSGADNNFDIKSLKGIFKETEHITISGGEPLIDLECYDLINIIKEESQSLKSVTFSSNFTKPNKKIIEALNSLECEVLINISIDGPPSINDYIRHGCVFDNIVENIHSNKNFIYGVNSTISLLNVGYIPELLDTLNQIMIDTGIKFTHIMPSPVYNSQLIVGNLPEEVRINYINKLKNYKNECFINRSQLLIDTSLTLLKDSYPMWDYSKKFLEEFDLATGTSYKLVYPELRNY